MQHPLHNVTLAGRLTRRAVRSRGARTVYAIAGMATSTLLVLVLLASYRSVESGVRAYTGQSTIDLWVAPRGIDNLMRSTAVLPLQDVPRIEALEGVAVAAPLLRGFATAQAGDVSLNLLAMGYQGPDGLGGPPAIAIGRAPEGLSEITIDRSAAWRLGVSVGDQITLNQIPVTVVGITSGTNLLATSLAFLDGPEAERTSGLTDRVSFVAVQVDSGSDPDLVAQTIAAELEHAVVWPREVWADNNLREVRAGFRPIQFLVSVVGIVCSAMLVGVLAQGAVDDRKREIAILFALGASAARVRGGILAQALATIVAGVGLGSLLGIVLWQALPHTVPTVELAPAPVDAGIVLAVLGGASLIASLQPLWKLRAIDPTEAFRP